MPAYKQPTFQERTELAAKAKQAALEKLRAKPPVDEAVLAERRAAAAAREEAQAKAREEKRAAREREIEERKARAAAEAAAAAQAAEAAAATASAKAEPVLTEAEKKAARDARYAARKQRKGKK